MELVTTLTTMAQRLPDLALAAAPEDLEHRALSIVFGVESVPVTLHAAG